MIPFMQACGQVIKRALFPIDFKFSRLWLVALGILFTPFIIYAGEFYQCFDKEGNESLMDFQIEGQKCKKIGTYEETTGAKKANKATVSANDKITKITVKGNQVFVPINLVYDNTEVNINLLMDTGATRTTIHTEVADRLYINLLKTKKAKAQVVGGSMIDASIITLDSLNIGPHVIQNCNIFVIPHEGLAVKFDGLLGMDVLGRFSYKLDLAKQVIVWE